MLLTDAGGGNGILVQLEHARIALSDIHDMFITHAHTDHILGAVWIIRMIIHKMKDGEYDRIFKIHSHNKVLETLDRICRMTLPESDLSFLGETVYFCEKKDGDNFCIGDIEMECFDILSSKEKQFGFCAKFPNGKRVVCLRDEPYNEQNRIHVENADWLLCEAFCLYDERDLFKPHEKHHSTALEAGILANRLNVRNLLLYHTEDKTLEKRKLTYTAEARKNFTGKIFVPYDLEIIEIVQRRFFP